MGSVRWLGIPFGLCTVFVVLASACGKELPPEVFDASADGNGEDCKPGTTVSCDGRCGSVQRCGVTIECGGCAAPLTCKDNACTCVPRTCELLKASCGTYEDGCGSTIDCKPCATGHCQKDADQTYVCKDTPCVAEEASKTCANKCGKEINNCGTSVDCKCDAALCTGGIGAGTCSCPFPPAVVREWMATEGLNIYHCYSGALPSSGQHCDISGFSPSGTEYKLHTQPFDGLVALHFCTLTDPKQNNTFLTTVTSECPGGVSGSLGFCASKPNVCGSVPLYRYRRGVGGNVGDYLYSVSSTPPQDWFPDPPNANKPGANIVCHVWE